MQLTPTITFRGIDPSAALEAEIRTRIGKLETYCRPIMGCHVLVELAERHHETGNRYHVRIDLTVPGEEIVVAHEASLHATAQDVDAEKATKEAEPDPERKHARVAVREAFDIARRRLQDYGRRQRGTVKASARQPRGRVAQLFPIDEYGYIEARGWTRGVLSEEQRAQECLRPPDRRQHGVVCRRVRRERTASEHGQAPASAPRTTVIRDRIGRPCRPVIGPVKWRWTRLAALKGSCDLVSVRSVPARVRPHPWDHSPEGNFPRRGEKSPRRRRCGQTDSQYGASHSTGIAA